VRHLASFLETRGRHEEAAVLYARIEMPSRAG
jgi:hypothetical protein